MVDSTHVITRDILSFVSLADLHTVGDETQDSTDPKESGETTKHLNQKLDPFGGSGGRG